MKRQKKKMKPSMDTVMEWKLHIHDKKKSKTCEREWERKKNKEHTYLYKSIYMLYGR